MNTKLIIYGVPQKLTTYFTLNRITLKKRKEYSRSNALTKAVFAWLIHWWTFINFLMQNAVVVLYMACASFFACFLGEFSILLLFWFSLLFDLYIWYTTLPFTGGIKPSIMQQKKSWVIRITGGLVNKKKSLGNTCVNNVIGGIFSQ